MAFFEEPGQHTTFGSSSGSDTDARPGSSENSPEFDRIYNPQGENEYTNLPENAAQLEYANVARQQNEYLLSLRDEMRNTLTRVQYWPHAGRFVIPKQNSFGAHLALIRQGNQVDIQFDPKTYLYFDKIIALHARKPELVNPHHPDYAKYETLRENIAALRNDIMGIYMDDGSFDPGDEKYLPRLSQIAAEIGDALNSDSPAKKPFFPSIDMEIANIEGEGAAYIYQYVHDRQVSNTMLGRAWGAIRRVLGQPDNQWQLPDIELTAFSARGLNMVPPADEATNLTPHELRQRAAQQAAELSEVIDPSDTHAIRDITSPERREAIKHGKVIIDWLKNIQFSDKSLQDFVDSGRPGEANQELDDMKMMVDAYYHIMDTAIRHQPTLMDHENIQSANDALQAVEHSIELMAKLENPHSQEDAMDIGADIANQPEKWHELSKETVKRLMERLRAGLEHAVAEIELQQQETDSANEAYAKTQVEDALAMQHAYMAKRAKKQKGITQQQRIDQALRADDRAAGQGAYRDDADTEDAIRIARQKLKNDQLVQQMRTKLNSDSGTKSAKGKTIDESMAAKMAADEALNKHLGGKNTVGKTGMDDELVKQLGKNIMAMQQQANVAASEIVDVKGGGIGTGESHTDRQDPSTNLRKNKPQIG